MAQFHPLPLPPLREVDAYTSWPGGVDPTVKLYSSDLTGKQNAGGFMNSFTKLVRNAPQIGRPNSSGTYDQYNYRKRKASRKHRKASRKNRKGSRKN
jgi:hypothetical protein